MRKPLYPIEVFKGRQNRLSKLMSEGYALLLSAHPEQVRNNDVHHPYRQDTNMFYMTGFEEPESVFLYRPGLNPETVLFVREKDKAMETWDGFRFGVEGAKVAFGVDQTFNINELESRAPDLLNECNGVYYSLYKNFAFDRIFETLMTKVRALRGRSGKGSLVISDSYPLIGEIRIFKDEFEVEKLKKACEISAQAHVELMKATQPGQNERALHGLFLKEIMQRGAAREGYGSILAGGDNATTLHYVFNDCELKEGELILVDAGAEYQFYTGDITRTYPINSRFTDPQKKLYSKVLEVQKKIIDMVRPGIEFKSLQQTTIELLTEIMLEEGILLGDKNKIIKEGDYKKYYPHGVGHWLGSDVHDAGKIIVQDKPRVLEPGMCFTVEPGLYIPENDTDAPKEFRGIGIRIEDNILCTKEGSLNMTQSCPKEIDEMEAIIGTNASAF